MAEKTFAENRYSEPSVRAPTFDQLEEIAAKLGLRFQGSDELQEYQTFLKTFCEEFNAIDRLPEPTLPVKYPRLPGHRPNSTENPLNGWYWKTDIRGAESGKLAGKTIAIKDNIAVAGVPMMNGCAALEGYIPEFDATVVTRILDAGGRIMGKSACESLCMSGSSFTYSKGSILNYHNHLHSAGGSSGGSATLVASGDVDMAVGGDQGGSVRIPASWCGIVGLKPTFGLVPYTGAMSMDPSVDHLGPMARTVRDCALLLEVLAGYDNGLDSRQPPNIQTYEYSKEMMVDNLNGIKVGLVSEGFGLPRSDPRVDKMVRNAVLKLRNAGAEVSEVSIPMVKYAGPIWDVLDCEGTIDNLFNCGGGGMGHKGFYPTSLMSFAAKSFRSSRINDLSHATKVAMLSAEYIKQNYPGQWYGKAQNLRRLLTSEYESIFKTFNVVAMPTVPFTAPKLPQKDASPLDLLTASDNMSDNLFPADLTGMPAISINVGFIDGLPVGAHFEAPAFQEVKLLQVAGVLEKTLKDTA